VRRPAAIDDGAAPAQLQAAQQTSYILFQNSIYSASNSCCAGSLGERRYTVQRKISRHVRAIPWPSGRRRARRRINTEHTSLLHSRERARGHVQPRCRGRRRVGRGKRCHRRHRSGGGPPASCDAHGRGQHSAAQRTCARRTGRCTWRTGGRVGPIPARRGASNHATRWRQKPPTSRRSKSRRASTITGGSSWARRTPEVAACGLRAQLGEVKGCSGAGAVRAL